MKKGFTLVELIAVISIMSVILLIGIPTYTYINNKMKENLYTSKVNELLAKGSVYAEETGLFAFSVNTLVEEGKVSSDNESGQILDPRDQRKMNCDIIRVVYENNQYEASYAISDACLSDEELNNQYGMFQIIVKNKEGDVVSDYDTWHNITEYYLSYELKEEYQNFASNILSVTWSGEGDKTCSIDTLAECDKYLVSATSVKRTTIVLKIEMNINESRLSTTYKVNLQMDNESPILVPGSMNYDNTIPTTEKRKVTFELSDNLGSGVSSYSLSPNKECDNYKESSDGLQTEYLDNGEYYLCVKDNVGLETSYFDDNDKIVINNVDNKDLTIYLTNSSSGTWTKNNVDINVISNKDKMDFCLYKYDNNEYARYNKSFISSKLILDSITEEQDRKLTLVCYDVAGNSSNEVSTNVKIDKTGPTISYAVASSTAGTSGWYKKLQLKVTLADSKSGVSSAKYCTTTNSSCTPTTGVTLTNNTFNINIPNGKQVLCATATDKVGNSTTKCSSAYSVDGSNPSVSYSIASKTSGENDWYKALSIKVSTSDLDSGIASSMYCVTTENRCEPSTSVILSDNAYKVTLETNKNSQIICANTTDKAGNVSSTNCSTYYNVDTKDPTAKISAKVSNSNITISAEGSIDEGSGINKYYYSKDGGNSFTESTSSTYTFTGLSNATYTLVVKVADKSGRVSGTVSTKATVNVGTLLTTYVTSLVGNGQVISDDPGGNARYYGVNPNNYVSFNGELWRIIGSFKNIDNGNGTKESRVKIIRSVAYSKTAPWDDAASYNYRLKANWSSSSLRAGMNGDFYNNFTSAAKNLMNQALWPRGGVTAKATASEIYISERNGTVVDSSLETSWTGNIALIYASDYAYATSGGSTRTRNDCLTTIQSSIRGISKYDSQCYANNWFYKMFSLNSYTLSPTGARDLVMTQYGLAGATIAADISSFPVLYLKADVKKVSGSGTSSSPYQLSL